MREDNKRMDLSAQARSPEVTGPLRGFVSSQPATHWENALVSGNGKIGALVYGQPLDETVVLNHARLYMPLPQSLAPPDTASRLTEIRREIAGGHYQRRPRRILRAGNA